MVRMTYQGADVAVREVPGLKGYYAGADGHIYSTRQGGIIKRLSVSLRKGYPTVTVMLDGKKVGTRRYSHRLVCEAWHGPAPSGEHVVRHLDNDTANPTPLNLAWGTNEENYEDRRRGGKGYGGPLCPRPGAKKKKLEPVPYSELREIPGLPGYLAGDNGVIYSVKQGEPYPLSTKPAGSEIQERITLSVGGKSKVFGVARLICMAYHGPAPSKLHEARHLNCDNADSRPYNLAWGTKRQNIRDSVIAGTRKGERHGLATLTDDDVRDIRGFLKHGRKNYAQLGRHYGVDPNTVRRAALGKGSWGHVKGVTPLAALPEIDDKVLYPEKESIRKGLAFQEGVITDEMRAEAARLRGEGMSYAAIGRELGVSRATAERAHRGDKRHALRGTSV